LPLLWFKWIMAHDHPAIARGHHDRLDGPA
jgi:hypothetical protein